MCMGSCRPLMAACTPKAEKATDSGLLQSNFRTEVDGKKTESLHSAQQEQYGSLHHELWRTHCFCHGSR